MNAYKKRTIAILVFDAVELLDFAGPFEVFSSVMGGADGRERLMDVFIVAETLEPVACRNGLVVQPAYALETCPPADILLVPGGIGTRGAMKRPQLINWIVQRSREAELTISVCTGSYLLAKAGLVADKPVTTHWGSVQHLRDEFPGLEVQENTRWVDAGNIITSAGVSAGIDTALHIVARLYGAEVARATARDIEYEAALL